MHLPPQVQLVALSATLSEPENFLAWIELARGRPGRIVLRKVRARVRARARARVRARVRVRVRVRETGWRPARWTVGHRL